MDTKSGFIDLQSILREAVGFLLTVWLLFVGVGFLSAGEAKPSWQVDWGRTVEAAKREGQVAIYGSGGPQIIVGSGAFQRAYPEIKVITVTPGRGEEAVLRLLAERRAGKYYGDLVIGGSSTPLFLYRAKALDPIKPALILPEILDESKWWGGRHRYIEPEGEYIFMYIGHPQLGNISYNTKLVNPKEFSSLWDFLNPKWRGKIEARDMRAGGTGQQNMKFFYYHPELGPKYIKSLFAEMDVTLFRDTRQSIDWLGTGRFAICFFCYPNELARAQSQGLPVDEFGTMKEGAALTSHSGTMGLVNRAPHPNAAKVFINWLLSRDGQLNLQRVYSEGRRGASNSLRIDIPKDMVPPEERLKEGVKYLEVETPDRMSMEPVVKVFEEALAEADVRRKVGR